MPLRPAFTASQVSLAVSPHPVTAPSPVMTTRFLLMAVAEGGSLGVLLDVLIKRKTLIHVGELLC